MFKKVSIFLCFLAFSLITQSCLNGDNKLSRSQLEAYADMFGVSADDALYFLNEGGEITLKLSLIHI